MKERENPDTSARVEESQDVSESHPPFFVFNDAQKQQKRTR